MKSKKTFKYCEFCNKGWEDVSPPTKEEYQNGLISIDDGLVLLPEDRVINYAQAENISGIYCNFKCLNSRLEKILYKRSTK